MVLRVTKIQDRVHITQERETQRKQFELSNSQHAPLAHLHTLTQ